MSSRRMETYKSLTVEQKQEFDLASKRLREIGMTLLAPHGARKHFIIDSCDGRRWFGKTWEESREPIGRFVRNKTKGMI